MNFTFHKQVTSKFCYEINKNFISQKLFTSYKLLSILMTKHLALMNNLVHYEKYCNLLLVSLWLRKREESK